MISKYCVFAALLFAALSIGLMIFIVIERKIYSDQLEGVNNQRESVTDEMFDWKADDFERGFTARFTVPTIIVMVFGILAIAFSIMSVVFKYCALS